MGRALLLLLLAAACAPAAPGPARTDRVAVVEPPGRPEAWGFAPATIQVPRGTTVTWHNGCATFHTVTADATGLPFDVALDVGKDANVTLGTPGTFAYHCGVHPQMKGVVVVCDGPCN